MDSATNAVSNAVSSLLKWKEAQCTTQKVQLIPSDEFMYLILTLKSIPAKPRTNAFKIPLPHPLHSSADICLIVDDRPASKPDPQTLKQLIRHQNLPIAKLLKLSKLKNNYKPFEAKRKLCDSYDLFLVDKRVVHFLPKLIGKSFFKKRKIPIPVDMAKNWKGKVEKAVTSGLLYFRTGTCCVVKVGKLGMERGEIQENVVEAIQGVVNCVPKKWGGVRSLHLKFAGSVALPLYQALPDLKLKIEGVRKEVDDGPKEGELESLKGDGVASDRKNVGRKKDKGRIHEVRYMDVGLAQEELVSQDSDGDGNGSKSKAHSQSGSKTKTHTHKLSGKSVNDAPKSSGKAKDIDNSTPKSKSKEDTPKAGGKSKDDTPKTAGRSKEDTAKTSVKGKTLGGSGSKSSVNGASKVKFSLSKGKDSHVKEKPTKSPEVPESAKRKLSDSSKDQGSEAKSEKKRRRSVKG